MNLSDDVIEVFHLEYDDRNTSDAKDFVDGSPIGAAFAQRNLFRYAVPVSSLVGKEAGRGDVTLFRQKKVDTLALLVGSTVEIVRRPLVIPPQKELDQK